MRTHLESEARVRREALESEVEQLLHDTARALDMRIDTTVSAARNRSPKPRNDTRVFRLYK